MAAVIVALLALLVALVVSANLLLVRIWRADIGGRKHRLETTINTITLARTLGMQDEVLDQATADYRLLSVPWWRRGLAALSDWWFLRCWDRLVLLVRH
jgi:hypothetical protein